MATNQIAKSSPIQNYSSAASNRSDKNPVSNKTKTTPTETKSSPVKKETEAKADQGVKNENKEIEQYLKMISRFENKLKKDEIEEKELDKIFDNLSERIGSLNTTRKKRLMDSQFFKKNNIINLNTMKDSLTELFQDDKKRIDGFDFLRRPEFISLIHNQTDASQTYSPASVKAKSLETNQAETVVKTETPPSDQKPLKKPMNPKKA